MSNQQTIDKLKELKVEEAHLKLDSACLEDLDYDDRRVIDKPLIRQLATCQWVAEHQNITINGATGVGKTVWKQTLQQPDTQQRLAANVLRAVTLADHPPPYARAPIRRHRLRRLRN